MFHIYAFTLERFPTTNMHYGFLKKKKKKNSFCAIVTIFDRNIEPFAAFNEMRKGASFHFHSLQHTHVPNHSVWLGSVFCMVIHDSGMKWNGRPSTNSKKDDCMCVTDAFVLRLMLFLHFHFEYNRTSCYHQNNKASIFLYESQEEIQMIVLCHICIPKICSFPFAQIFRRK